MWSLIKTSKHSCKLSVYESKCTKISLESSDQAQLKCIFVYTWLYECVSCVDSCSGFTSFIRHLDPEWLTGDVPERWIQVTPRVGVRVTACSYCCAQRESQHGVFQEELYLPQAIRALNGTILFHSIQWTHTLFYHIHSNTTTTKPGRSCTSRVWWLSAALAICILWKDIYSFFQTLSRIIDLNLMLQLQEAIRLSAAMG